MSIKVSSIGEYLYCPVKLYLKYHLEDDEYLENEKKKELKDNYPTNPHNSGNFHISKQFLRDFEDLLRRNLWTVKKDMDSAQIEDALANDVNSLIGKYLERFGPYNGDEVDLEKVRNILNNYLSLEVQIMTSKVNKIMNNTQKEGSQIAEMMFPPSLQSYVMRDKSLQISGSVDKIEIIEGKYYPIIIKSKNPPLRGVWDSDALELAAYSLLIEQEFDTDIMVGFIDYIKIDDRRPVIIDSELREGLFMILDHIRDIVNHGNLPEISINQHKCLKCDYMNICHQDQ